MGGPWRDGRPNVCPAGGAAVAAGPDVGGVGLDDLDVRRLLRSGHARLLGIAVGLVGLVVLTAAVTATLAPCYWNLP